MQDHNLNALDLLQNETRLGIILSLMVYDSLNLRKIAKIANIREPSAYEHVKALLNDKIIQLDSERAHERGKYYKLTPEAIVTLESLDEIDLKTAREDLKKNLPLISAGIQTPVILTKNFATYLTEYINSKDLDSKEDINEINKIIDQMNGTFQILDIKRADTIPKIKKIYQNFLEELAKINTEENEIKEKPILERYLLYTFGIPLQLINPNK